QVMGMASAGKKNGVLCVLVADEAITKLMLQTKPGAELVEMQALADPLAHARESDHHRDAHGRRHGGDGPGARNGGNATTSAGESDRHVQAGRFAKTVAAELTQALREKRFERLHLVAAPKFLGLLRQELGKEVAAVVEDEKAKDLIHLDAAALTAHLFPPSPKP
ncbi:MAG TPA: host attachment protein, partial [Rubrivivax sp.]|nr:host attachment protein [Rubrivivax sp.]